jgi:hypothetical protein
MNRIRKHPDRAQCLPRILIVVGLVFDPGLIIEVHINSFFSLMDAFDMEALDAAIVRRRG